MSQDVTCFIGVEACAARASPVIAARANWMFDDLKSDAKGMCPRDLELPRRSWTLRCRGWTLIWSGLFWVVAVNRFLKTQPKSWPWPPLSKG